MNCLSRVLYVPAPTPVTTSYGCYVPRTVARKSTEDFMQRGLTVWKVDIIYKLQWFMVLYISIWGGLELCLGGLSPWNPPWRRYCMCHIACWFRSGAVLKFDQFYHSSLDLFPRKCTYAKVIGLRNMVLWSIHCKPISHPAHQIVLCPPGPALADAGPNAKPRRGAPLSSDFMTSSCSVNRVTIVVERIPTVKH